MEYKDWNLLVRGDCFLLENKEYTVTSKVEYYDSAGTQCLTLFTNKGWIALKKDGSKYQSYKLSGRINLPSSREVNIRL